MKSKEELNALKEETETVSRKLHELNMDELAQVSGGSGDFGGSGDSGDFGGSSGSGGVVIINGGSQTFNLP